MFITSILLQFTEARKAAVAESVGLTSKDVDDMLTQYTVAKQTFDRLAQLKRDGKPMPKTIEEVSKSGFVITSCLVSPGRDVCRSLHGLSGANTPRSSLEKFCTGGFYCVTCPPNYAP